MTTLEDMDEILEELESRGVRDVMPVYFGWQRDGATRALGSGDFRIAPGLGSAEELERLMENGTEKGADLSYTRISCWPARTGSTIPPRISSSP